MKLNKLKFYQNVLETEDAKTLMFALSLIIFLVATISPLISKFILIPL